MARGILKVEWIRTPDDGDRILVEQVVDGEGHVSEIIAAFMGFLAVAGYQAESVKTAMREAGED